MAVRAVTAVQVGAVVAPLAGRQSAFSAAARVQLPHSIARTSSSERQAAVAPAAVQLVAVVR